MDLLTLRVRIITNRWVYVTFGGGFKNYVLGGRKMGRIGNKKTLNYKGLRIGPVPGDHQLTYFLGG